MIPAYTVSLLWVLATFLAVTLEDQGDSCNHPPRLDFAELADEYKVKNSFPVGSTVKYICRPGYVRSKPKISRRCLQNQEWSELEEFCKKKSCGHPGEPKNGWLHVSGDFLLGATVKYSCVEGYRLIGHSSRRCIVSDKKVEWTHDIPFCEPIPCFPPPDVPHGKHNGQDMDNFFVGTVVTYTCDKDYPLVGNASIYCTTEDGLNGVWSGRAYCGGTLHCPSPHVENGRIVTGKSNIYTYSQRVTIDCNVGHKISGSREIRCQVDGTWDPAIPTCKQGKYCQPPPNIQNGFHSKQEGEMFSHGMSLTYTCHPGYILLGQETIYCTASGTWVSLYDTCSSHLLFLLSVPV
uniref:Sushi domain-containing protein n=1 Tax=Anolis carolinensis TaxID=28377 RepID=A0A803SPD6_ANOCA